MARRRTTPEKAAGRSAPTRGEAMVTVRNVNVPGHVSRVNAAKYEAVRRALLRALPRRAPGLTQAEMLAAALEHLPEELFPGGAKAAWWVKTVQLDLEAKRLLRRSREERPLRWQRAN